MYGGALRETGLNYTGPFSLAVHAIDRAPETLGASLVPGAWNVGEVIEFEGDVDEFTFNGTAGQRISGTIFSRFGFGGGDYVELALIDPSNGNVLGTARSWDATPATTASVTLPATRPYLVRIYGVDDTRGKGAYEFVVR
jgi:hypothetical protein